MKKAVLSSLVIIFLLFFSSGVFALCVNASEANLRSGPGTRYEKTWEVFKYMPFKRLKRKGNWYKVKDIDGDVHWIYKSLVTSRFKCAVVRKENVNIRTGPGQRYSKTYDSPVVKYDSFRVIKRKGSWVKVADEYGSEGWIYSKLLWIQ